MNIHKRTKLRKVRTVSKIVKFLRNSNTLLAVRTMPEDAVPSENLGAWPNTYNLAS